MLLVLLVLGILIGIVFGKGGVALIKRLLMLAFGSILTMAGCAIV